MLCTSLFTSHFYYFMHACTFNLACGILFWCISSASGSTSTGIVNNITFCMTKIHLWHWHKYTGYVCTRCSYSNYLHDIFLTSYIISISKKLLITVFQNKISCSKEMLWISCMDVNLGISYQKLILKVFLAQRHLARDNLQIKFFKLDSWSPGAVLFPIATIN